jgi:hypothetical protein
MTIIKLRKILNINAVLAIFKPTDCLKTKGKHESVGQDL